MEHSPGLAGILCSWMMYPSSVVNSWTSYSSPASLRDRSNILIFMHFHSNFKIKKNSCLQNAFAFKYLKYFWTVPNQFCDLQLKSTQPVFHLQLQLVEVCPDLLLILTHRSPLDQHVRREEALQYCWYESWHCGHWPRIKNIQLHCCYCCRCRGKLRRKSWRHILAM